MGDIEIPGVDLNGPIGQGGFGQVFRGQHRGLGVEVAVKLMDVSALPPADGARALREAQLMARLDHPNLLRVFDAGLSGGYAYLVLEMMDGGSLQGVRSLPAASAHGAAVQLLSGLQALHDARILHRDVKPANCLRRARDERIKLADLGLALEATTVSRDEFAGTLPFMAPELLETPAPFGPTSDLYAVGMTLACLLLDEVPYPRTNRSDLETWVLRGSRPRIAKRRPDLAPKFASMCDQLIAMRPDERPPSAASALIGLGLDTPRRTDLSTTERAAGTLGPWLMGDTVYHSSNWHGRAVTHVRTGAPGRLMHLQPKAPLAGAAQRILDSAERAARLSHPRVVPVVDWGLLEGRAYVVTTARGAALDEVVRASGPCDELTSLHFAADLADALVFLHGQGLVYQNLDPGAAVASANARSAQLSWPVYCVPAGTSAEGRILVPRWAAPEALSNGAATIQTAVDLFGLGGVLYFLMTGGAPPRNSDIAAQLRATAPEVTAPTAALVANLLSSNPQDRPTAVAARDRARDIALRLQGEASDATWVTPRDARTVVLPPGMPRMRTPLDESD